MNKYGQDIWEENGTVSYNQWAEQHNKLAQLIQELQDRMKKLEAMHQETTHVHKDDMLRSAFELLLRVRPDSSSGLQFDISNWLEWYRKGDIKE